MNIAGWTLIAAPCLALAAGHASLQVSAPQAEPNTRIGSAPADLGDARAWREPLQSPDLSARESVFEALVDQALGSEEALARLEAWSNDREQLEFAWTCRLALREARARSKAFGSWSQADDPFEALRQHMFSGGSGSAPFGGFMELDPFAQRWGGAQSLFDRLQGAQQGSIAQSKSEGFTLEMGPDGVEARVKTQVDGEQHEELYSAKTLEELLLAHPELSEHVKAQSLGNGNGLGMRFGLPGFDFDSRLARGPRTDVLGVYVSTDPKLAAPNPNGLRIERVQPGSLAEKLGLEAGQVLTSLNGRSLKTRDDISSALRERKSDEAVVVEVRCPDGGLSTKTWKPSSESRGAAHPLPPSPNTRKI